MSIRINDTLQVQRGFLAVLAAALLALAVMATHGAVTADHHSMHHDGAGMQNMITICLAVLEAGVGIAVALLLTALRRRPSRKLPRPTTVAFSPRPEIAGLGPPGERPAVLQVFLR